VVVHVLVVRRHIRVGKSEITTHQRVQDLTHGEADTAQVHQRLTHLKRPFLHGQWLRLLVKQPGLDFFHGVVEFLNGGEVAVHDVVEQAVQQITDAVLRQVPVGVPHGFDVRHVEAAALAYGDQPLAGRKDCHLAGMQLSGRGVQVHPVQAQEDVRATAVDLRPLVFVGGVFYRELVEAELVREQLQLCLVR